MEEKFKDKYAFIVAFLAVVLAFVTFRTDFESIPLLGTNLFIIIVVFALILTSAAYIYALVYAFDQLVQSTRLVRVKEWGLRIANFIYFLGVVFPVVVIFLWFVIWILQALSTNVVFTQIIPILLTFLSASLAFVAGSRYSRSRQDKEQQYISSYFQQLSEEKIKQATLLYSQKFYEPAIVEAFKVLESSLMGLLKRKFYLPGNVPVHEAIRFAESEGLIFKREAELLHEIRKIRNSAVHGKIVNPAHQAKRVLGIALDLALSFDNREKQDDKITVERGASERN